MRYHAIIFDMDGTIVDTEHIWHEATLQLLIRRGIPITAELKKTLHYNLTGSSLFTSCQFIKEIINSPEPLEQLIQEKSSLALSLYPNNIRFIDGFLEFHQQVKQMNLKMGIATNASDDTLCLTNQQLGLQNLFGPHLYNISCVNNVVKPNPAVYLHAAKQLQVDPSACIAIEDSAHGIKAAKGAGMLCIGITTSGRPEQTNQADIIINHYREIDLPGLLTLF